MKKMLLFILTTIVFLLAGCEIGIKRPPKAVRQSFDEMFPGATHVEWEKVMSTYQAEFYHEKHGKEAQFEGNGDWLRTKTELSFFDVPEPVMKAAHEFCDWEIDDISLYEQATGVPAFYLIEYDLDQSPREKQLRVLPDGTVVTDFS